MRNLSLTVVILALAAVPVVLWSAEEKTVRSPAQVAVAYLKEMKAGSACLAIDRDWHVATLAERVMADDYRRLNNNDRNYVVQLLTTNLKAMQSMPGVADVMTRAKFNPGKISPGPDGEQLYTFSMELTPGQPQENQLVLMQVENQWKIIDMKHAGQGLVDGLRPLCQQAKAAGIPPVGWFEEMLAQTMQENLARCQPQQKTPTR